MRKLRIALAILALAFSAEAKTKWIGTWAASPQQPVPGSTRTFNNQTVRLIVHTSAGGSRARIRISNVFGKQPLHVGAAHIAVRSSGANIDPASDRAVTFDGKPAVTIAPGTLAVSDPVSFRVAPLSDVAVSLFFPAATDATTLHLLAKQTNYIASESGDFTGAAQFAAGKTFQSWPFLTGVDVEASSRAYSIVAFGSSLTDGDGSTADANKRMPDILAERLQKAGESEAGVLNEGIIGNRLLADSPASPFGSALGESGIKRFDRDVLEQPGVRIVIMGLGVNDILFPGSFSPAGEAITVKDLIDGYRQLIRRAHRKGIRMIGTTLSPFEGSFFKDPPLKFYTPEKEAVRREINQWILTSGEFDGVVDIDSPVRDPARPTRILPSMDSGDHLHPNDAGYTAQGELFPMTLLGAGGKT